MQNTKIILLVFLTVVGLFIVSLFIFKDARRGQEIRTGQDSRTTSTPKAENKSPEEKDSTDSSKTETVPEHNLAEKVPSLDRPLEIKTQLLPQVAEDTKNEIQALSQGLKENYDFLNGWLQLGALRRLIGDYEGAREALEFATILRPEDYVAFHNLGDLYGFQFKNYPKAEENFLQAIAKEPKNVDAYKSLAMIYQYSYTQKKDQTDDILLRGIEAVPERTDLLAMLARYYAEIGDVVDARVYYNKALEIEPANDGLRDELNAL